MEEHQLEQGQPLPLEQEEDAITASAEGSSELHKASAAAALLQSENVPDVEELPQQTDPAPAVTPDQQPEQAPASGAAEADSENPSLAVAAFQPSDPSSHGEGSALEPVFSPKQQPEPEDVEDSSNAAGDGSEEAVTGSGHVEGNPAALAQAGLAVPQAEERLDSAADEEGQQATLSAATAAAEAGHALDSVGHQAGTLDEQHLLEHALPPGIDEDVRGALPPGITAEHDSKQLLQSAPDSLPADAPSASNGVSLAAGGHREAAAAGEEVFAADGSAQEGKHAPQAAASVGLLHRLFVGWVPLDFTADDLRPYFEEHGKVQECIILKNKTVGTSRGCAFVSYATKEEAQAAIDGKDKQITLPGANGFMEVRFAKEKHVVVPSAGPQDNRQLFFARGTPGVSEALVRTLFGGFGEVEEVKLFSNRDTHISKGCGFVTMASRQGAEAALQALNGFYTMPGSLTPLTVQWADPDLQTRKRKLAQGAEDGNKQLFFARVPRTATEEDIKAVLAQAGTVQEVSIFKTSVGATTTKGCGLATMGTHSEAQAAIDMLNERYTFESMDNTMVLKWMDASLQKRRRDDHGQALQSPGAGPHGYGRPAQMTERVMEEAPPGCDPDTLKLFVGNVPKHYDEDGLRPFFEAFGTVVKLILVRDKETRTPRGTVFLWYAHRRDAEAALAALHGTFLAGAPAPDQALPLRVLPALPKPGMHANPAQRPPPRHFTAGGPGRGPPGNMHGRYDDGQRRPQSAGGRQQGGYGYQPSPPSRPYDAQRPASASWQDYNRPSAAGYPQSSHQQTYTQQAPQQAQYAAQQYAPQQSQQYAVQQPAQTAYAQQSTQQQGYGLQQQQPAQQYVQQGGAAPQYMVQQAQQYSPQQPPQYAVAQPQQAVYGAQQVAAPQQQYGQQQYGQQQQYASQYVQPPDVQGQYGFVQTAQPQQQAVYSSIGTDQQAGGYVTYAAQQPLQNGAQYTAYAAQQAPQQQPAQGQPQYAAYSGYAASPAAAAPLQAAPTQPVVYQQQYAPPQQ